MVNVKRGPTWSTSVAMHKSIPPLGRNVVEESQYSKWNNFNNNKQYTKIKNKKR
jgi:hypothetical protein